MKKHLLFTEIAIFAMLVLSNCKKDDPPPTGTKISERAKVVNESIWNQNFASIDSATFTLTFSRNSEIEKFKPGDYIISSVGEGLLRKVKSIQVVNNQVIVQTENATLTDVIEQGLIDFEQQLTISQVKSIDYYYEGIYLDTTNLKANNEILTWTFNVVLYDEDTNLQTTHDQIRLLGNFDCDWKLIAKIDIGISQGLKEVKFGFESNESLDLKLLAGLEYNFEKKYTLATVNFTPIIVFVGVMPVIFTPQLKIILGIDGYANASITTEITQELSFNAGLQYLKNSGWGSYKVYNKNFNFQPPQLNINAGATGYIKPEMSIKLYGITGPYANLMLYGKLNANLLETPWWKLHAGLNMAAGVKATILDKFVLDFTISDLINFEQQIAQATTPPNLTPIAAFAGSPTSGSAPLTVSFTDQSTNNPTSWVWDFGDGTTSTQRNPSKIYNSAGTYTVKITVTNSYGSNSHTKNGYITTNTTGSTPIAAFTGSPSSGIAPLTVNFIDQSTNNPTSWVWDFGDGTTSTIQNPTKVYNTSGSFSVTLTSTNNNGSNTHIKNSYISVLPIGGGLLTGLKLYWDFDQTFNSNFLDRINSTIISMNNGASLSGDGILNSSVLNNGSNGSGLLFGEYNEFNIKAMSFWIKPITLQQNQYIMHGKLTDNFRTIINYKRNGDKMYLQTLLGNGGYYQGTDITLNTGVWNHVVITENNNSQTVYLNGELVATKQGLNTFIDDKLVVLLRHQSNGYEANVQFDEFGVWDRVLEQSEILQLYNNGNGLQYPF
jgi:PKD repeat protein